jgi:hypothetical protein
LTQSPTHRPETQNPTTTFSPTQDPTTMSPTFRPSLKPVILSDLDIAKMSVGVHVHKIFSEITNETYYEADEIPPLNASTFVADKQNNEEWKVLQIPDEEIGSYLTEDEILSSKRDKDGNTMAAFCGKYSYCCLGATTSGWDHTFETKLVNATTNFHREALLLISYLMSLKRKRNQEWLIW